jgi:hypothetical protein
MSTGAGKTAVAVHEGFSSLRSAPESVGIILDLKLFDAKG